MLDLAARQRRPRRRRGDRRPLALGQDRCPAGGDDRLRRRCRLRARRARSSALARVPRGAAALAAAAVVAGAAGRRLRRLRLGGDGKLDVVATTTQIGDWVREVGGSAVVGRPDPAAEHRPARVRAAAERRRGRGRREPRLRQRRQPRLPGSTRSSPTAAATRRSSTSAPRSRSGCRARRAAPRPRSTTRTGGTTRATPRPRCGEIERQLAARRPRRTAPASSATPTPTSRGCATLDAGIARCIDAVPAGRAQAGHRSRRLRLLRPPLRDRRGRRRDPLPDDPGPALGQGRQRPDRPDRTRSG